MSFPAPSDATIDTSLDLNHLVKNPAATFFLRVSGNDMAEECIHTNDLLIVDRSLEAVHGRLVVAAVDGELIIRRIHLLDGVLKLKQPQTTIYHSGEFEVWGVITSVIHAV